MGKWLNGAQVRKREIDGKDTRIAALAAAGAAQIAGRVPVATAGLFAPALPAWEPGTSYAQYAAAQAMALQTEMDAGKERLATVEEALDLLLLGVTE